MLKKTPRNIVCSLSLSSSKENISIVHIKYLLHKEDHNAWQKDYIKSRQHLLKMHFGFILLLALRPIKDLHVKLRCTTMVIEEHKKH
jgi:hypothetical protein